MGLVRFVKIRMVGWKSFRDDILKELQKTGAVEIVRVSEEDVSSIEETSEDLNMKMGQVEFCLKSFSSFRKTGIVESLFPEKMKVAVSEYRQAIEDFRLDRVYGGCRIREEKLRELTLEAERLRTKLEELLLWKELPISPGELKGTGSAELLLAKVPRRSFGSLREEIDEIGVVEIVGETKTTILCLLICLRKDREPVDTLLKDSGSQVVRLPEVDDSESRIKPCEILEKIDKRLNEIEESKQNLRTEAEKSSLDLRSLLILHDHLSNIRRRKDVLAELRFTESIFILDGWIAEKDLECIVGKMEKKFPEIHVEIRQPEEGEIPPVELENKAGVRPFEAITDLYGLPDHREMDPTPLLAPFFALFFALCLTDAGYGVLLILLSWICLRKLDLSKAGRYLMKVLTIAGVVTVIVGCLTGGIFGFQFEQVPEKLKFLRTFRNSLTLLDLSGIISGAGIRPVLIFFVSCLGLGFLQVWFGFLVKMYQQLRDRHRKEALCGQLPWLLILPGLILVGLVKKPEIMLLGLIKEAPLSSSWLVMALVMILLGFCLMFLQPGGGNIFKRIGLVIYHLYDGVMGSFGNILSYVRLFALGLATMAMAMALNIMVGILMDIPKVGIILAIPIVIVGHFFNMIINVLSGFIHTVRLQFVEFFTKFYEGGGRSFRPFAVENKYTELMKTEVSIDI